MSENPHKITRFIVFCLEAYRTAVGMSGPEALDCFEKYGVVEYLTEGYDVLHSLGEQALVEEVIEFLKVRGFGD